MKRFFVYSKRTTSFYKLIGKLDTLPLYMKYVPEAKSLEKEEEEERGEKENFRLFKKS